MDLNNANESLAFLHLIERFSSDAFKAAHSFSNLKNTDPTLIAPVINKFSVILDPWPVVAPLGNSTTVRFLYPVILDL